MNKTHIDMLIENKDLTLEQLNTAIKVSEEIYDKMPSCKPIQNTPLYPIAMCQKYQSVYEKTLSVIYEKSVWREYSGLE